MGAPKVCSVDGAEVFTNRGRQHALINEIGYTIQHLMLLDHVWRLEQRTHKHYFPMQRNCLHLQRHYVEGFRIIDCSQLPLWAQNFDKLRQVNVGVGQTSNMANLADSQLLQLRKQGLAVINDVVSTQLFYPIAGLGT